MRPLELRKTEAVVSGIIEGRREPLPVELLASESARRTDRHFSEINQALADPIHDHRPQTAPGHKVNRTLAILDELDRGNSNRRFTP